MVDFLLLYENKSREIESICLLKVELEKKGHSVAVCHVHYFSKRKYKAKVVITPFLYDDSDLYKYVYCICGKAQKVINLRWEQIYSKENEQNLNCFFYPKNETQKAIHLCWGEKQQKTLLELGINYNKLPVVGPVHLELLTNGNYFCEREYIASKNNLNTDKKWILFVSSFSNTTFTEIEKKNALRVLGEDRVKFIDVSIESKKKILEWLMKIIKDEQYEIIYRPHPSEKKDISLQELEKKEKRFHVIMDDSVGQWIYCSDYVFNWYSTSAVQSVLLGKGNVVLRPVDIPDKLDISIFDNAFVIKEYEQMKEVLNNFPQNRRDENFEQYYSLEGCATEKIVDICNKIINSSYSCEIDYGKILSNTSLGKRIKHEIIYKIYGTLLKLFCKLNVFSGLTSGYKIAERNKVSREEQYQIEKRISKLIND